MHVSLLWIENFNHMHTGQFYMHNKQFQERKVRIDYLTKIIMYVQGCALRKIEGSPALFRVPSI